MKPLDTVYDMCRYYIFDQTDVDTSLKDLVLGYLRARSLEDLSTCSRHYDWHGHSVVEWRFLRQIEAFFKKNALFADTKRCFEAAANSFMVNERNCSETNLRIKRFMYDKTPFELKYRIWTSLAQRYIQTVLGDYHSFTDDLPSLVKVTSGASSQHKRAESLPHLKMTMRPFCTERARKYLFAVYHKFGYTGVDFQDCKSNRVELVPKNWKTDRTIACEPEGNLPLQLAFDTYAKRRLRAFGIDLRNQSANKELAKSGSINGTFCTVDMKAASDTISYNTVCLLFPDEWFSYLRDVRTPLYRGVFGTGVYSKFSSMGNGSTFCIETLIFAAVCKAIGSKKFLVYGDDIIIEPRYFNDFCDFARFLGFTVNKDKTFIDGPFRESCGGDYFNGVDVTPVYIRRVTNRKADWCHIVNVLQKLTYEGGHLDAFLRKIIKEKELPYVPINESTNSGIWISPELARKRGILCRRRVTRQGPTLDYFKSLVPKHKNVEVTDCRGYALWFLNKRLQVVFKGPWDAILPYNATQTSSVPIFQHKYVRKWVSWFPPASATVYHYDW